MTGHGAGAALHAVSVANALRQRLLPSVDFRDPGAVITALKRAFPMETHNELMFTLWYGVLNLADRAWTLADLLGLLPVAAPPCPMNPRRPPDRIGGAGLILLRHFASAVQYHADTDRNRLIIRVSRADC